MYVEQRGVHSLGHINPFFSKRSRSFRKNLKKIYFATLSVRVGYFKANVPHSTLYKINQYVYVHTCIYK